VVPMDGVLTDYFFVLFALIFYAFMSAIYLIRARGLSKLELMRVKFGFDLSWRLILLSLS
jgi:hypothetical protein